MSSTVSEEDVMKTRLLIDGDGTGEDRRINNLMKLMFAFLNVENNQEEDNGTFERTLTKQYEKMLSLLAASEWSKEKSAAVRSMNHAEAKHYDQIYKGIEEEMEEARRQIEESRQELKEARLIRNNRMEYDALAKVISQNPDRKSTAEDLAQVAAEMETLKTSETALEEKLEMRKKQFHVLVHSLHQLRSLLDLDEEREEKQAQESKEEENEGIKVPGAEDLISDTSMEVS